MSQLRCSCGREFAFEATLQRHCSATGHHLPEADAFESPEVPESGVSHEDPRDLAMRVLNQKRAEQATYELHLQLQHQTAELSGRGLVSQILDCLGRIVDGFPDLDWLRLR